MSDIFATFNPIFWIFISYTVGALGTGLLKKTPFYSKLENHNYINDRLTKVSAVLVMGWLVRHTFMKIFNKNIKYTGKLNRDKLLQLREHMTDSEIGHLIGFIFLLGHILVLMILKFEWWQIILYFIFNIIFNLYLVLLQQYNKRRIDRLLKLQ